MVCSTYTRMRGTLLLLTAFALAACAAVGPYQIDEPLIREDHFDLGFIEFTESGNLWERQQLETVLSHVRTHAAADAGATVVVFVHGWKHDASPDNGNLKDFKRVLSMATQLPQAKARRLIGIYVGWRGESLSLPWIKNLSYWDRKRVAEEIGKGGVTEMLLRLEHILNAPDEPNHNQFLVVGHSMGGAILLSSLTETLLERILHDQPATDVPANLNTISPRKANQERFKGKPFSHGLVLINTAIEANEMLQLKEQSASRDFARSQDRYVHILTSDADAATSRVFRLAQRIDRSVFWRRTKPLERWIRDKRVELSEDELKTWTAGHYEPFVTGRLQWDKTAQDWHYTSYVGNANGADLPPNHIPVNANEPLAIIKTDASFMCGHNDFFNENVIAYLLAIMTEGRYKRSLDSDSDIPIVPEAFKRCLDGPRFRFGECFDAYLRAVKPAWQDAGGFADKPARCG